MFEANIAKLKRGERAAAFRNFELHFPDGLLESTLVGLSRFADRMTTADMREEYKDYFDCIATSTSDLGLSVPSTHWGGSDTLRMASYLLDSPIYLISVVDGDSKKYSFTVFKSKEETAGEHVFRTAGEYILEGPKWYAQIRHAKQMAVDNHSRMPIVITFKKFHYSGLVFRGVTKGGKRHYASSLAKFLLPASVDQETKHRVKVSDNNEGKTEKERMTDEDKIEDTIMYDLDDLAEMNSVQDEEDLSDLENLLKEHSQSTIASRTTEGSVYEPDGSVTPERSTSRNKRSHVSTPVEKSQAGSAIRLWNIKATDQQWTFWSVGKQLIEEFFSLNPVIGCIYIRHTPRSSLYPLHSVSP